MDSPSKVAAVETEVRKYKNTMFINIGTFHSLFLGFNIVFYVVGNKSLVTISIVVEKGLGQTTN